MQTRLMCICLLAILAAAGLSACATAPPEKSAFMNHVEGLDVTKLELQTLVYTYGNHFAGQLDLACNEIYSSAANPDIRHAAIEWNLNATPEMMVACFNRDPLVGLLSAWTFAIQLREFFEEGNGRNVFGPQQSIANQASRKLEADISNLAHGVWPEGDINRYEQHVADFAAANPLKNMRFVRGGFTKETMVAMAANVSGGLGAAGSMNEQMVALTGRSNIMMSYLQRQIYWQSAMIMEDGKKLVADLTDSTLVAVREEVFGHLDPIFEFADEQRALMVGDLAGERSAILLAIANERNAVLNSLAAERGELVKAIANERNATMRDIDALTLAVLERVSQESQSAVTTGIDRIYMRTLQLLVVPFLLVAVFVVVVMLWVRNTINRVLQRPESGPSASH